MRKLPLLLVAMTLVSLPMAAQPATWRDATITISLNQPGKLQGWISMYPVVPESVAQRFAVAMGCPAPTSFTPSPLHRMPPPGCSMNRSGGFAAMTLVQNSSPASDYRW